MTEHIYESKLVKQNDWAIYFPINDASPKERIIRCRDCFYWRDEDYCINPQWRQSPYEAPCTYEDSFCSFAATPDDIEKEIKGGT